MTYREAAIRFLKERGPLHYQELAEAVVAAGAVQAHGATPAATLNATIAVDIRRKGKDSVFIRVRPGVFGLRELHEPTAEAAAASEQVPTSVATEGDTAIDNAKLRVRVPLFPVYSELRHLLRVWPGCPRKQVTGLQAAINELRGTPQKTVDWTDPATWIPKRLKGGDRDLARPSGIGRKVPLTLGTRTVTGCSRRGTISCARITMVSSGSLRPAGISWRRWAVRPSMPSTKLKVSSSCSLSLRIMGLPVRLGS